MAPKKVPILQANNGGGALSSAAPTSKENMNAPGNGGGWGRRKKIGEGDAGGGQGITSQGGKKKGGLMAKQVKLGASPTASPPTAIPKRVVAINNQREKDLQSFQVSLSSELDLLKDRMVSLCAGAMDEALRRLEDENKKLRHDLAGFEGKQATLPSTTAKAEETDPATLGSQGEVPDSVRSALAPKDEEEGAPVVATESEAKTEFKTLHRWAALTELALKEQDVLQQNRKEIMEYAKAPLELKPQWQMANGCPTRRLENLATIGWKDMDESSMQIGDTITGTGFWSKLLVGHPHGVRALVWGIFTMLVLAFDAITIPLNMFDLGSASDIFVILQGITIVVWLVDMPMSASLGFQNLDGLVELRLSETVSRYMKRQVYFDAILCVNDLVLWQIDRWFPASGAMLQSTAATARITKGVQLFRVMRLIRLQKTLNVFGKIIDYSGSIYIHLGTRLMVQILGIVFLAHYIACGWLALADNYISEVADTWVVAYQLEENEFWENYLVALHWALTQFCPATNNIAPESAKERAFAIVVVLFALVAFSSFLSSVTNTVTQARRVLNDRIIEETKLKQFMFERGISTKLFSRTQQFFKQNFAGRRRRLQESDIKFWPELPESFRMRFHTEMYVPVLRTNAALRSLVNMEHALVIRICHLGVEEITCVPGADVFVEGTEGSAAYYIVGGKLAYVSIFDQGKVHSVVKETWLAEMSLWVQWIHRGHLCARTKVDTVRVLEKQFSALMTQYQSSNYGAWKRYAVRLLSWAHEKQESGDPICDLQIPEDEQAQMVDYALKVHALSSKSWMGGGVAMENVFKLDNGNGKGIMTSALKPQLKSHLRPSRPSEKTVASDADHPFQQPY